MINMAHCRFENTLAALKECRNALDEKPFGDVFEGLSDEERKAAIELIELCGELSDDYGDMP